MKRRGDLRARLTGALAVAIATALYGAASNAAFRIGNPTVAGGGGRVANTCFTLTSTIGEHAAGFASNGTYTLTSGFQAAQPRRSVDVIFRNGFDGQPKECIP